MGGHAPRPGPPPLQRRALVDPGLGHDEIVGVEVQPLLRDGLPGPARAAWMTFRIMEAPRRGEVSRFVSAPFTGWPRIRSTTGRTLNGEILANR